MNIDEFMRRIAGVESGNPNAVNKDSGAHGTYQIMPANWPSWSREAGLGANAPKTAANQERVAKFKMQQYYDQYGDWGAVAAAWYGGGRAAAKWAKNPNDPYLLAKHGKYPSIRDYVGRVLGTVNKVQAGARRTPTSARTADAPDDVAAADPQADSEAKLLAQRQTWEYQMASLSSVMGGFHAGSEEPVGPPQSGMI